MKRILFCAGLLAFMASCTQDEFEQQAISNEAQAPGVSFVGAFEQTPTTKGEVFGNGMQLDYKWYAEQDQINVFAKNIVKGGTLGTGETGTPINEWTAYIGNPATNEAAIYKATRSQNNPWFTGASDDNILYWPAGSDEENVSEFLAIYPRTVGFGLDEDKVILSNLPSLANQTQESASEGNSVAEKTLMVAYETGYQNPKATYESVGERVNLVFGRPMGYLGWSTANYDSDEVLSKVGESMSTYFGKLKSITLEAQGRDTYPNFAPSILDYGTANMSIDLPTPDDKDIDWHNLAFVDASGNPINNWANVGGSSTVKLTYNGTEWKDGNVAYMLVSPVDRSDYRDWNYGAGTDENMKVTYEFEHISLVVDNDSYGDIAGLISCNGAPSKGGFKVRDDWGYNEYYWPFTLDIAKYPYLVTNHIGGYGRALIINDADLAEDIMTDDGKVYWNGEEISTGAFGIIISKVPLCDNDKEIAELQKFGSTLRKLILVADTEIPSKTFDRNKFTKLEEINFPAVTNIAVDAFVSFGKDGNNGLTTVKLKSYPFENRDIAFSFLDDDKLEYLDMSAAKYMNVGFPSRGFTLEGYSTLKEVVVGTVEVGPNSFDGCAALATISPAEGQEQGNIKLSNNGFAAFRGTDLATIHLVETPEIPAYAFYGCDLLKSVTTDETVLTAVNDYAFNGCVLLSSDDPEGYKSITLDNVQTIGEYAFYDCKVWEKAKLQNTTNIGKCAFKNCAALNGDTYETEDGLRKVVYVGATTVGSGAFHMCTSIEHIEFTNATVVERGLLGGASSLIQIQFNQPFTCNVDADESTLLSGSQWSSTFGQNTRNTTLFVNKAQQNRNATQLTIGDADNTVITFKSILNVEE